MRPLKIALPLLAVALLGILPAAIAQNSEGSASLGKAKLKGTAVLGSAVKAAANTPTQAISMPAPNLAAARRLSLSGRSNAAATTAAATALSIPTPESNSVTNGTVSLGFVGLNTIDTANVTGFIVTPPDQGLCAGHGFVVEAINLAIAVYGDTGNLLMGPASVISFFGADPNTTFLSDPKCYFDRNTQRWFVTMTNVLDFVTFRSNIFLAVSQSSDPRGAYYIYSIDTTDDGLNGTPTNAGCTSASPCFGDQPLLGADANGIYVTTNEFGVFSNVFNGAQIYALGKLALEAGKVPAVVHIGNLPLAEGPAYSVQPATSPDLSTESAPGVEYFLSALDFNGTLDNRIAVWSLTNTSSLSAATPNVTLKSAVLKSEVYGQPPPASQKAGPYPFGQGLGAPEVLLNSDDDRMQQVTFADGHLWGALNTIVSDGTSTHCGIAYFDVRPSLSGNALSATVQGQNYVSVKGASVLYPAVAVTAGGKAAAVFSLTGPAYYPSAAYAQLTPSHAQAVNIVAAGGAPSDDASGYPLYGGNGVARWGDYSAALAVGDSIWMATEYIPGNISSTNFLTNFGTYISKVTLQ